MTPARRAYRYWSPAEADRAEALRLEGFDSDEIAALLGRSTVSTRTKLARLGVAKPVSTRLLDALRGPHRLADVARRHGLKVNSVLYWKRRYREMGFSVWRCPRGKQRKAG